MAVAAVDVLFFLLLLTLARCESGLRVLPTITKYLLDVEVARVACV
jgi:hypothetical protein